MSGAIPEGELAKRRPVWAALSELFLDTELRPQDEEHLAEALAASPYSLEELEAILHDEVAPVVARNLRSTAGVWQGFEPSWLEAEILGRRKRRLQLPRMLRVSGDMREAWRKCAERIGRLRDS